jgi:ABC-type transport system involved in cytochrome bd biosynthesis fused ATPase/permease subunit
MHRVFAILLFVVLLATTIFGHVLAQSRVSVRMIDVERQRLEELKAKLETTLLDQKGDRYKQAQQRWNRITAIQNQIDELDRDPENYFYKKQRGAAVGNL